MIQRHARESFLPDGGYEERSTCYTVATLNMFLMPVDLAERNGISILDPEAKAVLRRLIDNLADITLPCGELPDVGDERARPEWVAAVLSAGARDLGARHAAGVLKDLKMLKHVKPETAKAVEKVKGETIPLVIHQPDSGYFVARDGWTPRSSAMAMNVPAPGLPNHAHDDALSLQLVVKGEPMVGTPLTEIYVTVNEQRYRGSALRGAFYAMTSHNVVLVDGKVVHDPEYLSDRWGPPPIPCEVAVSEYAKGCLIEASHEGFEGVRLSREVLFEHERGLDGARPRGGRGVGRARGAVAFRVWCGGAADARWSGGAEGQGGAGDFVRLPGRGAGVAEARPCASEQERLARGLRAAVDRPCALWPWRSGAARNAVSNFVMRFALLPKGVRRGRLRFHVTGVDKST